MKIIIETDNGAQVRNAKPDELLELARGGDRQARQELLVNAKVPTGWRGRLDRQMSRRGKRG